MAKKSKKNIFKIITGLENNKKKWQIATSKTVSSEKWIYHVLPADAEAPNIEDVRKASPFLIVIGLGILIFLLIGGRLFSLQVVNGSQNLKLAEGNRVREKVIRAPRGIIYDAKGLPLVKNVPNYDLTITPSNLPYSKEQRETVLQKTAALASVSIDEVKKKIAEKGVNSTQAILISKNISKDNAILVESQIKDLNGVRVEVNPIREYLDDGLLSHSLGYVGRISEDELKKNQDYLLNDYIGKSGVEKTYERYLRGVTGKEQVEVDSEGRNEKILGSTEPIPGDNLKLSIDFGLQQKITESLQKQMKLAKVSKASAVAMNPQTGEILAMVSLPTYDNNLFAKGISDADYSKLLNDENKPLVFRPVAGEYPSGSSIKPFIAAGALEEGTITESSTVNSTGGIRIGEFTFPDWKAGGHGVTNVLKAIAESVNTFFYAIGGGYQNIRGLGPEKMKSYLEKFGFGNYVGLDILGESKGSIPDPEWKERVKAESWYLGDTYNMAIGQGDVLVTPLQIANATSIIANGGTYLEPHLVSSILDENGQLKTKLDPKIIKSGVISAKTDDIIKRAMRQTVTSGSAASLKNLPVEISGKTGTAQFGPNNSKQHAWFTSFAPSSNPTIELTILLEGAGGGDVYAVPVASDVYKYYFTR
ncbi:MAG: penicillin-binding protein 2 [Patescibacteria group bacterium]